MADSGAENLRKQIAFLSSLIDSHKSGKHEEKPVLKRIPNKSCSRWNTESAFNKNKTHSAQNKQLNKRQQRNKVLDNRLPRKILYASNIKGYASSNKLTHRKAPTNNTALLSNTKLQNSNTTANITSRSQHNITTTSSLAFKNESKPLHQPASNILSQFHVSQLAIQQKSEDGMKYNLHREITSTKSVPLAPTSPISSLKTMHQNVLTKSPLSSSYSGTETPLKAASITYSSGYLINQQPSNERQPKGNLKWTKNEMINSWLPGLKSTAENEGEPSNCIVVKPHIKNPSLSSFRHAKPVRKPASLPANYTRNSVNQSFQNSSMIDRNTLLPKTQGTNTTKTSVQPTATVPNGAKLKWRRKSASQRRKDSSQNPSKIKTANSKAATNITRSTVNPAIIPKGAKLKWRRKSAGQLGKESSQNQSKPHRRNSKTKAATSATKTSIQQPIVTKGAKLKWRRRSASQLRKDSNKNPKSKNLFRDDLQTRMALKSKWQTSEPSSTILCSTVYNSTGSHHLRTSVNHLPNAANGKRAIRSHHTKNILQLRTEPRRTRLKWNKSLSQTTKSDQMAVRKVTFAYKSRFSLKRRKSTEGKSLGVNGIYSGSRRVQHGAVGRVKSQNKGFVARRMKYISLGSRNQIKPLASKYSFTKNAPLRPKITIGGNHYIISSRGMTLKKTMPSKNTKTTFSTAVRRRSSLHVYRKSAPASSNCTIHRIIKRQNSVDMNKTRTANKILKRTLQNVQAVMQKDKKQPSKEYCMFYNKFGKCTKHKQGICPYIHDPTKIAVCTRFLRGKCQQTVGTCPFSHKIDKEKMPICQYFLKGKCNRDDCPYAHVNVGPLAVVCEDFLKGYCALGFKCKKKHVLECEEFSTTGQCPNGNKCKLIHRKKVKQRKRYFDEVTLALDEEDNIRVMKKARRKSSDGFLPLAGSTFSEDERLTIRNIQARNSDEDAESANVSLRIRPNFTS